MFNKVNRREMNYINTCPFCGKENIVEVNCEDFILYAEGEALVQDAFPYLSPNEREVIISGICGDCWDKAFGGED